MEFLYDPETGNLSRVIDAFGRAIDYVFETQPDGTDRLAVVRDFLGRAKVTDVNGIEGAAVDPDALTHARSRIGGWSVSVPVRPGRLGGSLRRRSNSLALARSRVCRRP